MGKKGASSWLTAVKRAFRSPTKDNQDKGRNCRRKENHLDPSSEDHDDDHRKKERRRWLFKKGSNQQEQSIGSTQQSDTAEQQHAVAVAVATAAVAAAQAAIKTGKITKSSPANVNNKQHIAAIVIQTAFRGYLARRALKALKGLVKLQALVRGHNVRKQAKMTLKCMQALVRVQSRVLDQRMRLSHEGSRKSTFSDTNSLLESRYFHDLAERRSVSHSREASSIDDWDERPHTIEEVKAMLQTRKDAAFKREKSLSHAFTQQIWRSDRRSLDEEGEETTEDRPRWLDRWMANKPWDSTTGAPGIRARASTDHRDTIKTVEIDTAQPYSYLTSAPNFRRSTTAISSQFQPHQYPNSYQRPSSPLHTRASHNQPQVSTPSPSSARTIQVRSASPRCGREDRSYNCNVSQTPSLRSNYYNYNNGRGVSSNNVPNYMIATESAKARVRSQSAPRQRPLTPERDRDRDRAGIGPKKRLSYPNMNPDPYGGSGYGGANLRSPSFKSVIEQQSNYSSCCTDSLGGEISPSSTSDLRRWLR